MADEFTVEGLHKLVDQAMSDDNTETPVGTALDRGPRVSLPFTFGDTQLLERLTPLLERYLPPVDVQTLLDELRSELATGIERPKLRDIHTIVHHCRRCPEMTPDPALPVGNLVDPHIVFVHELPFARMQADSTFLELLAQSNLPATAIAHTSVVRCEPKTVRAPSHAEINTCVQSYLYTELSLLQPRLIMPLGTIATNALLGSSDSMGRDRGKIFWLGPWAILPSYSPGYVYRRAEARDDLVADLAQAYRYCFDQSINTGAA